jgi:hypothetical protein
VHQSILGEAAVSAQLLQRGLGGIGAEPEAPVRFVKDRSAVARVLGCYIRGKIRTRVWSGSVSRVLPRSRPFAHDHERRPVGRVRLTCLTLVDHGQDAARPSLVSRVMAPTAWSFTLAVAL